MRTALRTAADHGLVVCLTALVISLSLPSPAAAELRDSRGTDFWLAFPRNQNLLSTLRLFITGDTATTGTVTVTGSTPIDFSVSPDAVTTVPIPSSAQLTMVDGTENKGIHVIAANEVTVYGFDHVTISTDAYLGLPTDVLGTEYIVLTYRNRINGRGTAFAVVATEPDTTTTVKITPSVTVGSRTAGTPYTVSLTQGQAYQLSEVPSLTADLSGSIIEANHPVAVFGAHRCALVPPEYSGCNHLIEQLLPTSAWGRNFVTMPLASRLGGDTFRFIASEIGTTVTVNGGDEIPLERAKPYETILDTAAHIESTQPILVAQYSNSKSFDGTESDPFMMLIPPTGQFLANYRVMNATLTTPALTFERNFLNVVVPDAALDSITLDDVALPATAFSPIGMSGFSGLQQSVEPGYHTLSGPLAFGASVYGFTDLDGYGYPGGLSLDPEASVGAIIVTPETYRRRLDEGQGQHCVIATVYYENGNGIPDIWVKFSVTGTNSVQESKMTDGDGAAMFCYPGAQIGEDSIVASVGSVESNRATVIWFDNEPPDVAGAAPTLACLWPTNHVFASVGIVGITDPDNDPVTITITGITTDEATATVAGAGGGHYAPDAGGVGTDTASIRAERSGPGDGRVYRIWFNASDGQETVSGSVAVGVPHDQNVGVCGVDSGQNYDATIFN